MKLDKFLEEIRHIPPEQHADIDVIVQTHNHSIGPIASTAVKSVGEGIDWDNNKLIITTEKPLVFFVTPTRDQIIAKAMEWHDRVNRNNKSFPASKAMTAKEMFLEGVDWAVRKVIELKDLPEKRIDKDGEMSPKSNI